MENLEKWGDLRVRTNKTRTCCTSSQYNLDHFTKKLQCEWVQPEKNLSTSTEHNTSKIKNRTKSELK